MTSPVAAEMKASRELDAEIAEKVMGWALANSHQEADALYRSGRTWYRLHDAAARRYSDSGYITTNAGTSPSQSKIWNPSTDIRDAWLVVDRLLALGFFFSLDCLEQNGRQFWRAETYTRAEDGGRECDDWNDAATAPLAICKAAFASLRGGEK